MTSPLVCATCGGALHWDSGWAHEDPSRVYGHVADPGEAHRTERRERQAAILSRTRTAR